jgi:hypothetical protein
MMEEIIAAVFAEMSALYGKKFADQWSGVDPETLKSVWEDKLSRYASRPDVIRMALDDCENLNWPPTLPEFLALASEASVRFAKSEREKIKMIPRESTVFQRELSREEVRERLNQIARVVGSKAFK